MAGSINFSVGNWFDSDGNGTLDAPAGSLWLGGIVGNPYSVFGTPDRTGPASVSSLTGQNIVTATNGHDLISLQTDDTVQKIYGLGGDDDIFGSDTSHDTIRGGTGADTLFGGALSDRLAGDEGDDILHGEEGEDSLYGGADQDYVDGGDGQDLIHGGDGNDTIFGGAGADTIYGGAGNDVISDEFHPADGANTSILAGEGDDRIMLSVETGTGGTISGGAGHDKLEMTAVMDHDLSGFSVSGVEQLLTRGRVFATASIFNGFSDIRNVGDEGEATPSGPVALVLSEAGSVNFAPRVVASNFLDVQGSSGNDRITGHDGIGILDGRAGNDTLIGGGGNDTIDGGEDNDSLSGGEGNDSLIGGGGDDTLNGGLGANTLVGGAGNDTYILNSEQDVVAETGGDAADEIRAAFDIFTLQEQIENVTLLGNGDFQTYGNLSDNTLRGNSGSNSIWGFDGNDRINGNAGTDTLYGESGNDTLLGGLGSDTMDGGHNNDLLNGGEDNDRLHGGESGLDVLTGGAGADTFVFTTAQDAASNRDRITDFVSGEDIIELNGFEFTVLGGLPDGPLDESAFYVLGSAEPQDEHVRVIYDAAKGRLYFDMDGAGGEAPSEFAILNGAPALTHADFVVVGGVIEF